MGVSIKPNVLVWLFRTADEADYSSWGGAEVADSINLYHISQTAASGLCLLITNELGYLLSRSLKGTRQTPYESRGCALGEDDLGLSLSELKRGRNLLSHGGRPDKDEPGGRGRGNFGRPTGSLRFPGSSHTGERRMTRPFSSSMTYGSGWSKFGYHGWSIFGCHSDPALSTPRHQTTPQQMVLSKEGKIKNA